MDIRDMALQNPWWSDANAIEKDSKVAKVLESGEKIIFRLDDRNLVLIGPRQLGKTTALKYDIYTKVTRQKVDPGKILYYSFETARDFETIKDVIESFVTDDTRRFLYLDEVNFVKDWQRAVKFFLDSPRSKNARLYITGSSSINLRRELMPGRNISFMEFLPLSFRDFAIALGSKKLKAFISDKKAAGLEECVSYATIAGAFFEELRGLFSAYIQAGGYPDAIMSYLKNGAVGSDIYDVHWDAMVSEVSKAERSVEITTAVLYGILKSYSSKVNLSAIARMQGIKSHVTVREYLEMLGELFVSGSIFPVSEGRSPVFRKERKVYFSDPLLYNAFARKLNFADAGAEPKIVEGIVYSHLDRLSNEGRQLSDPRVGLGYYSGKREIDFIAKGYAVEVKWQEKVDAGDFPPADFKHRLLLSKNTMAGGAVPIVPVPMFLAFL